MSKKLANFVGNFSSRNANTYTTKDIIDSNLNIPSGPLEPMFQNLLDRISSFENTLIFGARGVGKTLYLKKAKFDYLHSNKKILPIFIDLTHIRDLFKDLDKITIDDQIKKQIFDYYLKYLMISEIASIYDNYLETRNKSIWKRYQGIFNIVSVIFGVQQLKTTSDEAQLRIQEIQSNLTNPFDVTSLSKGGIEFKQAVKDLINQEAFNDVITQEFNKLLTVISSKSKILQFLLIFDEFSMLSEEAQNILASIIIGFNKISTKGLKIRSKVSIMEGRFHVDTADYNFIEHDFGELHFEQEFKAIFSGPAADDRLLSFYTNILRCRMKSKKILTFFENQIAYRNLCYFAGFKVRDFLASMHEICDKNRNEKIITNSMVYNTCSKFYQKQLPKFLQKVDSPVIDDYLKQLCKFLRNSKNKFHFISEDFKENFFQVLLYYKIITFVSYIQSSSDQVVDTRGFLIDLSTSLQLGIITKAKLNTKTLRYLDFSHGRNFVYNQVGKKTEQIVINLIEKLKLSDKQILESVPIKKDELKKLKEKIKFNRKYNSESLVDEDPQVDEDDELRKIINELSRVKFITYEKATYLATKNISKDTLLAWSKGDLNQFYIEHDVPRGFKGSITKGFNELHRRS